MNYFCIDDYGNEVFKVNTTLISCYNYGYVDLSSKGWIPLTETWVAPYIYMGLLSLEDGLYMSKGSSFKFLESMYQINKEEST